MIDFSVIIPFYGDPADTLALIEQLKVQQQPGNVEIIVSDDCSPVPFPRVDGVQVVRRESNGGFGANVNTGVSMATNPWIIILNSDLTLPSDFLVDMAQAAQAEGDAVIAPQIVGSTGESQWVGRDFPKTRHHAWEWFTPAARLRSTRFWHFMVGHNTACTTGNRVESDWLMGACLMMRKTTFDAVNGMDERFFMNSEEVDLQFRLSKKLVPRIFRGDIVVSHEGGGSSGDSAQRTQWLVNSRFIYEQKWGNPRKYRYALTAVSLGNFIFNIMRKVRNPKVYSGMIFRKELNIINTAYRKSIEVS